MSCGNFFQESFRAYPETDIEMGPNYLYQVITVTP